MAADALVLVANAQDSTIGAYALRGDRLEPLATTRLPGSCSTFAVDPVRDLVYASTKGDPPLLVTLRLDRATGALVEVARATCAAALHYLTLARDGSVLLGAAYHASLGLVWPVDDGVPGPAAAEVHFQNLHCVVASPDDANAYFVALGAELIAQYALAADGKLAPLDPPTVPAPAGSGPRHLTLSTDGRRGYLVTEFSGEVIQLDRDSAGRLSAAGAESIVDPAAGLGRSRYGADPRAEQLVWGADVHLARAGRFVLASERSASTLATLALDDRGGLGPRVALRSTEAQPRGFDVSPDSTRVVAVGELSTEAALYAVGDDGVLTELDRAPAGRGANWVRIVAS